MTRWVTKTSWAIFGCYLYPYALPRIFGPAASEFTDRIVDLRSAAGQAGADLEERMLTANDNSQRVEILSAFLTSRLSADKREISPIFYAINKIIVERGLADISELSSELFISRRQFERRFKEFAGFSPKTYARIVRFQTAVKEYGNGRTLTEIAYECGYYDQSHFINDFREFSGYSPKTFFTGAAEGSEYLQTE